MADNKFISILKSIGVKIGIDIKKAVAVEQKLLPFEVAAASAVSFVNPAVGTTLTELVQVVGQVEQVATAVGASAGTGAGKLAAAIPGIEAAILSDPIFKGKKVADLSKYNVALAQFTGAFVDLLNSFEGTAAPAAIVPAAVPSAIQSGSATLGKIG